MMAVFTKTNHFSFSLDSSNLCTRFKCDNQSTSQSIPTIQQVAQTHRHTTSSSSDPKPMASSTSLPLSKGILVYMYIGAREDIPRVRYK